MAHSRSMLSISIQRNRRNYTLESLLQASGWSESTTTKKELPINDRRGFFAIFFPFCCSATYCFFLRPVKAEAGETLRKKCANKQMFAFGWQVDVASRQSLDAYSRHSCEIINEKSSYGMWLKTERCFVSSKQTKINVETLSIIIFGVFSLDVVVVSLSLDGVVSCDVHTNCVVVSDVMSHSLALFRVLKLKGDVLCRCSSLCLLYSFTRIAHTMTLASFSLSLAKQQLRHELHSSASDCDVW